MLPVTEVITDSRLAENAIILCSHVTENAVKLGGGAERLMKSCLYIHTFIYTFCYSLFTHFFPRYLTPYGIQIAQLILYQ